jgi:ATP-binding protein involved in chromosome partitioning
VTEVPVPVRLRRQDGGRIVEITWDEDGHTGRYAARTLRLGCQCAACVEEMSGRPILDPASVPDDVHALGLRLVGAYALHIAWSDGHSSGIYPWDRLLAACPCDRCAARRGDPTTT